MITTQNNKSELTKGYSVYIGIAIITINILIVIQNNWVLIGDKLVSKVILFEVFGLLSIGFFWSVLSLLLLVFNKPIWKWLWLIFLIYSLLPFPNILNYAFYFMGINVFWMALLIVHLQLNPTFKIHFRELITFFIGSKASENRDEFDSYLEKFKNYKLEPLFEIAKSDKYQPNAIYAARTLILEQNKTIDLLNYLPGQLSISQKREITQLWNTVFPTTLAFKDLRGLEEFISNVENVHFTLAFNALDELEGCFIAFWRNEEQFFSILVADKAQGKGLGTQFLKKAKEYYAELNGWMVDVAGFQRMDGSEYYSPEAFYVKNDFEVLENERWDNEKVRSVKIRWRKGS